jgi:hypothetical protein
MRTTLNLDDDALDIVRNYSEQRSLSMGEAASELVRRGSNAPVPTRLVDGFVIFDLPPGGPKITSERVKQLLEDELP